MGKKLDPEFIKSEIAKRDYVYNYHYNDKKELWLNTTCPKVHESIDIRWDCFYKRNQGCPKCGREKTGEANRIDLETVKIEITKRGYAYNSHFYKNKKLWINATCPQKHPSKDGAWNDFLQGCGCRKCYDEKNRIDLETVKIEITKRGYAYNSHFYKKGHLWINATCPENHEPKDRTWNSFQQGHACRKCYNKKQTLYKSDAERKFAHLARCRFRSALKHFFKTKKVSAVKDLGCTVEEAVKRIESKFHPNPETGEEMNWANYGKDGWEVDHKKPFAKCDLDTAEGQKEAIHYTNLQPLWVFDNRSKGAKWEP